MSDSARLRYTYGILHLIFGIFLIVASVVILMISTVYAIAVPVILLIIAYTQISKSIYNFIICGMIQAKEEPIDTK